MKTSKKLLFYTGFRCNNNCIICSIADCKASNEFSTYSLKKEIIRNKKHGFDGLELTGGEPTVRSDIHEIIAFVKRNGISNVSMATNGRMFAYTDFCRKIVKAGLDEVSFSLLGDNAKIHDKLTRTKGSFAQIVQGIKNIKNYLKIGQISVTTVINTFNVNRIRRIADLISSLGIKRWEILYLKPDGAAKGPYKNYAVNLERIFFSLDRLVNIRTKFDSISFHDFPLCTYPEKILKSTDFRVDSDNEFLYKVNNGYELIESEKDKNRLKMRFCKNCIFEKRCPGVNKDYILHFGTAFIEKQAKKINRARWIHRSKKLQS